MNETGLGKTAVFCPAEDLRRRQAGDQGANGDGHRGGAGPRGPVPPAAPAPSLHNHHPQHHSRRSSQADLRGTGGATHTATRCPPPGKKEHPGQVKCGHRGPEKDTWQTPQGQGYHNTTWQEESRFSPHLATAQPMRSHHTQFPPKGSPFITAPHTPLLLCKFPLLCSLHLPVVPHGLQVLICSCLLL